MALPGHTFDVRRMQTHDGPGIRTTVFMKGCSLRCEWCHNPESFSGQQEVWWIADRCIGCGKCVEVCPENAIRAQDGIQIDRSACTGCAACAEICPSKAIETLRTDWTVESLFDSLNRDRPFLLNGGGVTVSGGEPALQTSFVRQLLERCQADGLHTALDTCGAVSSEAFSSLLPHCDLVLFDLKLMDPEAHRKWTGQDNFQTLENIKAVDECIRNGQPLQLWIRTPLIPGATATKENIAAIGKFIKEELSGAVERWELCAFNNLCTDKYRRLGKQWSLEEAPLIDQTVGENLVNEALISSDLSADKVLLKGRMGHASAKELYEDK